MAKFLVLVMSVSIAFLPSRSGAEEYFGKFLDKLEGTFIHDAKPRPLFHLSNDYRFDDPNGLQWVAPAQTKVDGASIPQAFWSFFGGPFEGAYINASVIHDYYCVVKTRTAYDTHRNFYYGMRASGVESWKAKFMYWAVSTFGPSWTLQAQVTPLSVCSSSLGGGGTTCTTTFRVEQALVETPAVDLTDPEVLAVALSKATAIAKTLRTTDGQVLDLTSDGKPVLATVEALESSGAHLPCAVRE